MAQRISIRGTEGRLRRELEEVDEWALAGQASVALAQVLLTLPRRTWEGTRDEAGPVLQLYAQQVIGIRVFRTVRAAMAVLEIGYEPEARALDRILVELMAHRRTIQGDPSGEEARSWLAGERGHGISGKVNAMQPKDLYPNVCQDAHGDPRGAFRLYDEQSESFMLSPIRRPLAARASLLMYAGTACDQTRVVADLAGFTLSGIEALVERVRSGWERLGAEGDAAAHLPLRRRWHEHDSSTTVCAPPAPCRGRRVSAKRHFKSDESAHRSILGGLTTSTMPRRDVRWPLGLPRLSSRPFSRPSRIY